MLAFGARRSPCVHEKEDSIEQDANKDRRKEKKNDQVLETERERESVTKSERVSRVTPRDKHSPGE